MGATYTRQSSGSIVDGSTIEAAHFNNEFDQLLAAFASSSGHTHDGTSGEGGPITKLLGTSITIGDGTAGTDITVTFDGETGDGVLKWMEDEDYFEFSDDILVASTEKLQFRDTAIYLNSSTDGQLDIVADTEVQIAATTVDINGNVDISGTLTVAGALDFGDANITNVGSLALDTITNDGTDITLDSSGDIILDADGADITLKDAGTTFGSLTNSSGELVIKSGSTPTAAITLSGANATVEGNLTVDGNFDVTGTIDFSDSNITNAGSIQLDSISGDADSNTSITFSGSDVITMATGGTSALTIDASQNVTIAGDLTVSGDDITMATNTAGNLLIADGTNFNSVAVGSLSEISTVASDDVLLAVDTSGGGLKKITRATLTAGIVSGSEISNLVEDSTPQLGGDLDVNGNGIVSASNGNIALTPNGTGVVRIDGSNGIDMQSGAISIKNSGAESYIRFYCESSNAHYSQLQASPHSAYSGNVTLVLPASADTLVGRATTDTLTNKTLTTPVIAEIDATSDFTLDAGGDIILDADGGDFNFKDGGTEILRITNSSSDVIIRPVVDAKDLIFQQRDGTEVARVEDNGTFNIVTDKLAINGTAVTSTAAELNILDGVTATTAEINLIDGGATVGTTAIADGDGLIINDAGTMRVTTVQTLAAYLDDEITAMPNLVTTAATTVGALDSGSITSGFGNIDNGSSNITSGGLLKLDVDADADDLTGDSTTGRLTIGAGEDLNLYHGGTNSYIVNDTGDLIIDTAGDIKLDAAGNDFKFLAGGTEVFNITNSSSDVILKPIVDAKDIIIQQRDGNELVNFNDGNYSSFTRAAFLPEATLTDGATISWDTQTSSVAKVTLGGNRTLGAATNAQTGQFVSLLIIQDGTGSRTVTFNAVYEFTEDTAPTLTTTANKGDLFVFRYNGSKFLEVGRNLNLTLS